MKKLDYEKWLVETADNKHYIRRYVKFIQTRSGESGVKHHIMPKSLFPTFEDFREHAWNCVVLTDREHFIAHLMLARAFTSSHHMSTAIFFMAKTLEVRNSRLYEMAMRE